MAGLLLLSNIPKILVISGVVRGNALSVREMPDSWRLFHPDSGPYYRGKATLAEAGTITMTKELKEYMNPYWAGFGLGLVLLASYLLVGRGLGASGAFASFVSWVMSNLAPDHIAGNGFFEKYLSPERAPHPLKDWLIFEVIGIMLGGLISGLIAGRVRFSIDRGPQITTAARLALAFTGGILMSIGAQFARGCTSGQALSGGALLNLGSWIFMICVFAAAYLTAYFVRRQWL